MSRAQIEDNESDPVPTRCESARRHWPGWLRLLVSVAIVMLIFEGYAGWHWSSRVGSGPGVTFSPTGAYVGRLSTMALTVKFLITEFDQSWIGQLGIPFCWNMVYTLSTVFPAALVGVLVFSGLSRRYGKPVFDVHTRCRRCDYILFGLTQPLCPECGERI